MTRLWTDNINWLRSAPASWTRTTVGRVAFPIDQRNDEADGRLLSLSAYTGVSLKQFEAEAQVRTGEELSHYWRVGPEQLVVNPMWLNHGAIAVSDVSGVISPDYRVFILRADVAPAFAHHVFRSDMYRSLYGVLTRGHTTYDRRISKPDFNSLPFVVPPLAVQRAIADFLDRKTAAIDALISKKERLLALLAEQRAALIHRAVTRGLDPDVEMKDSELEWIGEVPAHWEVRPSRHLIDAKRPVMYGIVLPGPHVEGGVPVVKANNCRPERLRPELMKCTTPEIESRYVRSRLLPGDVVIAIRGSIGSTAVVPSELRGANLTQDAARLAPSPRITSRWLWYLTMSPWFSGFLGPRITGSTVRGVNIWDLARVLLPDVPRAEQERIAAYLDDRLRPVDGAMRATTDSLDRLREYRQALITAAVTGQLDLSSEAAA